MAIDRSEQFRKGSDPKDIEEYLAAFTADSYPATTIAHSRCGSCGGAEFTVRVDDEEGCAERACVSCGERKAMLDSAEYLDEADLEEAVCPCGSSRLCL